MTGNHKDNCCSYIFENMCQQWGQGEEGKGVEGVDQNELSDGKTMLDVAYNAMRDVITNEMDD